MGTADGMSNIEREKALEAVEDFLRDTFEAPLAMGEEWLADQADAIVELVLEAAQPQGAVSLLREAQRYVFDWAVEGNENAEKLNARLDAWLDVHDPERGQ